MNLARLFRKKISSVKLSSTQREEELTVFVQHQFRELSKKNLAIHVQLYNL